MYEFLVLFLCVFFHSFFFASLLPFLSKEREKKRLRMDVWGSGEDIGGDEGGESVIGKYCMDKKKILYFQYK